MNFLTTPKKYTSPLNMVLEQVSSFDNKNSPIIIGCCIDFSHKKKVTDFLNKCQKTHIKITKSITYNNIKEVLNQDLGETTDLVIYKSGKSVTNCVFLTKINSHTNKWFICQFIYATFRKGFFKNNDELDVTYIEFKPTIKNTSVSTLKGEESAKAFVYKCLKN